MNWVMRNDQRYLKCTQEKKGAEEKNKYHEMTFSRIMIVNIVLDLILEEKSKFLPSEREYMPSQIECINRNTNIMFLLDLGRNVGW